MKKILLLAAVSLLLIGLRPIWGFFAHQKINKLAVFTLPPEMIGFYKKHLDYIGRSAVNPDRRRYAVAEEAPRHYLDVDHYGDSAFAALPRDWAEAVAIAGEDTLQAHGVLPWHIYHMYLRLRDAFLVKDPLQILRISAELGHYIGDAHVPLHTTRNYNGQLTGQDGIHGFWESRLPEVFSHEYNFFVGRAEYIPDPRSAAWSIIASAHRLVGKVLSEEKKLAARYGERRHGFERRGNATAKVYALPYTREYHRLLDGMVEAQMCASIKMTGNFWYTAWVDAGQPDLSMLIDHHPTEEEVRQSREAMLEWKAGRSKIRDHE